MGKRVLVVDDSYADRILMRDLLLSFGYSVVGEAREGRESVRKYKELKPDLMVVDVAMPEMDGAGVVREVTRDDPEAVILVCAGRGQRALAMEAVQAGAKDFVVKPVQPRPLLRVLTQLTREKQPVD